MVSKGRAATMAVVITEIMEVPGAVLVVVITLVTWKKISLQSINRTCINN